MTRIYVDSSALLKRIFDEPESAAVREAILDARATGAGLTTSALARVEVARVARMRLDADPPRDVAIASSEAFLGIAVATLTTAVLQSARIIGPPTLRSLDAIHLATAVAVGADEVWTYDRRMAEVAEGLGILARAPV